MAGMNLQNAFMAPRGRDFTRHISVRLIWESQRIWRWLGWGAVVGLICCSLSLLALWQTNGLIERQQSLAKKLLAVQSSALTKSTDEIKGGDISDRLSAFYAYLPSHDAIPDQLKQLVNLAQQSGVTLIQADYKPQPDSHADFLRYQITLPVKADYLSIQTFIIHALQELPTLTLESVSFKRDRIEASEVEARIQYVLLIKKPLARGIEQ